MTKYHSLRASEPCYGLLHSRHFIVSPALLILMTCFATNASAENWKLRIKNTTSAQIKVIWGCSTIPSATYYYKKDTDTFPGSQQKTRELSSSKCDDATKLAVKIMVDNIKIGLRDCTYADDWELPGIVEGECVDGGKADNRELWNSGHDDYRLAGHKSDNPAFACIKVTWTLNGYRGWKFPSC